VGDEPLLLAATGEAWIGRDRAAAAQAMTEAGTGIILMDDGHQNPSLAKDFTFIVIDAGAPFGNGHVLPKGPLREPVRLRPRARGRRDPDGRRPDARRKSPPAASQSCAPISKPRARRRPDRSSPLPASAGRRNSSTA
jgi:hypothetical protein